MQNEPRESWDEYFLGITQKVATRATCLRRKIGAVAVKDKRIMATGFNGAPPGIRDCCQIGTCLRDTQKIPSGTYAEKCMAVHAEQNLFVQAAYHGINLSNAEIYCTNMPCIICMKMLIGIKPKRLVYVDPYPDKETIKLLNQVAVLDLNLDKKPFTVWTFFNWK